MNTPADNPALISRRSLLQTTAVGFGHLAFSAMLNAEAGNPLAPRQPPLTPRAKRVVFLFMKGGPSHVDTFDPKPLLTRDHGKKPPFDLPRVTFAKQGNLLKSPWAFSRHGQSGLPISSLFPHLSRHADDLCVLRSVHGTNPAHGGALLKLHTGSDNFIRPSMGAWVVYGLGTENENLPAFITICPTLAHGGVTNWGAQFLPAHCQGTPIGNASLRAADAKVSHIRNSRIERTAQRRQLDLLAAMNRDHLRVNGSETALLGRLNSFELAYRMQTAMPDAQNVSGESAATKRLYGVDDPVTEDFGRQCLMARRFLERGVRFVQVTHSDSAVQWDQHSNLYQGHTKNAAEVDKPIAGFLTDLKARGLLDDTLVMWGGEFGRTPTAQGTNGRDHNPHGFTMWFAGAGVKGGFAYGATDDYGYFAQEDKMHVHDLHATLLHALGIEHTRLTFRHGGRDHRLTDVSGHVAHKIFA